VREELREASPPAPAAAGALSVLVVTFNRCPELRALLPCLLGQSDPAREILVVDNASTDGTSEMLSTEFPQVRALRQSENLGCIAGRNVGLAAAEGEVVISLDDDATCGPETIAQFAAAMARYPRAAVVAARLVSPDGAQESVPGGLPPHPVFRFSAGAAALRKAPFLAVGGYPVHFQRGAEELDLAWRLWDGGWTAVCDPAIVVRHPVHRKSGAFVRSQTRNEIWTGWRHLPLGLALAWALGKSVTHPLVYLRRGWAPQALLGVLQGWAGMWRERRGCRPVSRETVVAYRRVRALRRALLQRGRGKESRA
jgi:GT2 family glycosyltransferase